MDAIPLSQLFIALILLIGLSAFFSGSETSLMALNRYRLKHQAEAGVKGARRAEQLLARPDRLIGLILLGNNFVNIMASSVATVIALRLGGEAAIGLAAGILTLVVLVFAEVAPKTLAALHPERLAYPAATIYSFAMRYIPPLGWTVRLVNLLANGLLRLLKVEYTDQGQQRLSREELRAAVNEAGAMVPERHKAMLLSILDLETATVDDIMIPRNEVEGIDFQAPMDDILRQLQRTHYTRLPLYDGNIDEILGILHSRDAMHQMMKSGLDKETLLGICRDPYYIPEGTPLNRQLLQFQRTRQRVALIVDEYGDLVGMATLADLLEEIVGEFTTDPAEDFDEIMPQPDGSYLVDGSISIRDLNRTRLWRFPREGAKTLNGRILDYLETIPEPGTSLRLAGCPMEILQTTESSVKTVRLFAIKRDGKKRKVDDSPADRQ